LNGYQRKKVKLSEDTHDESLIVLRVDKSGHRISGDPRRLDFRVFRSSLSGY
jgi:hypothetical protein